MEQVEQVFLYLYIYVKKKKIIVYIVVVEMGVPVFQYTEGMWISLSFYGDTAENLGGIQEDTKKHRWRAQW